MAAALVLGSAADSATAQEGLRIAAPGDYPPFNTLGPDGELQGFDIDIARALCVRMSRQCDFVEEPWDALIGGLLAGRYDAVAASLPITEARQEEVAFTEPYYRNPLAFVARRNAALAGTSPDQLAGRRLGAQAGTAAAERLRDRYSQAVLTEYPTMEAAFSALAAGVIDAALADAGVISLWLQRDQGQCCAFFREPVGTTDALGIALRPEDGDLKAEFDKALEAIVADGTYGRIAARYFPFPLR